MIANSALRSVFRWTAVLGSLAAVSALPAAAVVVDQFTTAQGPLSDPPGGATSVPTGGADILGQHRGLVVDLASGAGPVDAEVTGGFLIAAVTDTTPDSRGSVFVTWDGDTNANVLDATGLGGADLTGSGHTAIAVTVDAADAGVEIVLEVYTDAADMSRAALRLPAVASSTVFYLSYKSDFVTRLGTGADFADVGAVVMTVRGSETAVTIDKVETAAPGLAVVKEDLTLANVAIGATAQPPGTTFKYKVTITNTGGEALAVDLSDTLDANTTISAATLDATPVAVGDAYEAYGNVTRTVAAPGLLANDVDPDQNGVPPELVVDTSGSPVTTTLGGTATLSADGAFVYEPPAGVGKAVDTFTYTVTDNEGNATTATATMNIGRRIWFVDDDADVTGVVDGTGTLADPYDQLTPLSAAGDPDEAGDLIFVYAGTYASGIELEAEQELIGHAEGLTLDGDPIVPVGAAPTINDAGGHGIMVATDNTIRGLTVGNTAGADVNGGNFGTLTVSNVTLNGTGAALNLSNGTLAAAFNSMSSTNSLGRGVNLDTVTGSLTSGSTSVTDSAQAGIRVVNGGSTYDFGTTTLTSTTSGLELMNNATSTFTFASLAVTTDAGPGLMASSSGTLNIGGAGNTIVATGGAGVDVTSTSFGTGATFSTVSSTGNAGGKGINLDTVTGSFTATGGAISGAGGIAFDVNAGMSTITYAGSITNTSNRSVEVTGRNGGTVTLSGTINDTGTGINVASNTSGMISFSGTSKIISTGASPAVTLATNGAATINFTGGGLDIDSTSGIGFNATGGAGGVTVSGSGNSITSTTGTALSMVSTNIGSEMTFQSISANGASKGIVLQSTGPTAGLTVTGTGVTDGSGGTIQNITARGGEFITTKALSLKNMNFTNANTSDGGTCTDLSTAACNAAIYLSSVTTVTFDNINVTGTTAQQAINGINVSDLTLTNSTLTNCGSSGSIEEGCIKIRELTGTCSISSSDLSFPGQDVVEIVNMAGPTLTLDVDSSTFRDSQSSGAGGNGIQARSQGTASMVLNVTNSSFLRLRTNGLQATAINSASNDVDVTNSTFDTGTGTMIGLDLDADNTGTLVFNVQNNPMIYARNGPAVNVFGDTNAVISGRINNNPDVQVKSNVGSNVGSGIRVNINKDATAKIEVKNNVVNVGSDDAGIDLSAIGKTTANPGGATNTLDATVTGNNVTIGATSTYGIIILSATNAGDTNALCANVGTNAITRNPASIASFRARVPGASGFFRMEGFVTNAEATWNAKSNTPTSTGGSEVSFGGSGTFAACVAALPTNPGPS